MANFKNALNLTISEMLEDPKNYDAFCCAVYWDDMCEDNAIVMFMEYEAYGNMHAVMKDLNKRLSEKMGHPVSLCHNHPTDELVLIHGGAIDSSVYYSDECCKKSFLEAYANWNAAGRGPGYRPEYRSVFFGAECVAEGIGRTPEYVLNCLDWNKAIQAQMIQLLIDYHN